MRKNFLLPFIFFGLTSSFHQLFQLWREGKFQKRVLDDEAKYSHHVTVKKGGGLIGYFDPKTKKIKAQNHLTKKKGVLVSLSSPYLADLDIEEWDDQYFLLYSYYLPRENRYKIHFPDDIVISNVHSPIRRTFINVMSSGCMLSLALCQNGTLFKQNISKVPSSTEMDTEGNSELKEVSLVQIDFSFHVRIAEFFYPFLYMVDEYNRFHIYCPEKEKILYTFDFRYQHPIQCFHVFHQFQKNGIKLTIGLQNNTVHTFSLSKNSQHLEDSKMFRTNYGIKAVYSDGYKSVVAIDNSCLLVLEANSGKLMYETQWEINTNYFQRMYIGHQALITDGNAEGLVTFSLKGGKGGEKEIKNREEIWETYEDWIVQGKKDVEQASPSKTYSFLDAINQFPVPSKDILYNMNNATLSKNRTGSDR